MELCIIGSHNSLATLFFITKYWGGTKDIVSPLVQKLRGTYLPRSPLKLGPWRWLIFLGVS